jgi:hypothetical protein
MQTVTLHLKVQPNAWPWLDRAARKVNTVWNWGNETSRRAIQTFDDGGRWLSAYDLDKLAAGASACFDRIGSDVIQRVNAELVSRRIQFRKTVLRFRASGGRLRALGCIPFKAVNLNVKSNRLGAVTRDAARPARSVVRVLEHHCGISENDHESAGLLSFFFLPSKRT